MKLNDLERGYVAGIIDGEGSIILAFGRERFNLGWKISPKISVQNIDLRLLEWLRDHIGGSVYSQPITRTGHHGKKPIWSYTLSGMENIRFLLEQNLPLLIVKREHAEIMLRYCNLRKQHWHKRFTQEEFDLANRLRQLNGHKGNIVRPTPQPKKKYQPWNKGKYGIYSEETLRRMSEANKGKHLSPATEFKKGLIPWNKDKHSVYPVQGLADHQI